MFSACNHTICFALPGLWQLSISSVMRHLSGWAADGEMESPTCWAAQQVFKLFYNVAFAMVGWGGLMVRAFLTVAGYNKLFKLALNFYNLCIYSTIWGMMTALQVDLFVALMHLHQIWSCTQSRAGIVLGVVLWRSHIVTITQQCFNIRVESFTHCSLCCNAFVIA